MHHVWPNYSSVFACYVVLCRALIATKSGDWLVDEMSFGWPHSSAVHGQTKQQCHTHIGVSVCQCVCLICQIVITFKCRLPCHDLALPIDFRSSFPFFSLFYGLFIFESLTCPSPPSQYTSSLAEVIVLRVSNRPWLRSLSLIPVLLVSPLPRKLLTGLFLSHCLLWWFEFFQLFNCFPTDYFLGCM